VIHETLRFHPNTGLILERVVPKEGAVIDGYALPAGTIVGVNAWTIHFDKSIYGEDVDVFRPERWLETCDAKVAEMKRFIFSVRISVAE
jgi:cytochrome P450